MLHPNEIAITESNKQELFELAEKLGKKYLEALAEQVRRQEAK